MSNRQKQLLGAGLAVVLLCGVIYRFSPARGVAYETAAVQRGVIAQESLASGNVEAPTTANLRFNAPGKLALLKARVGDRVKAGQVLARQDTSKLEAMLSQALSSADAQKAQLQTLTEGTRQEQLDVTQAQIDADAVAVERSRAAEASALRSAYTIAASALENTLDPLFNNPRSTSPSLLFTTSDSSLKTTVIDQRVALGPQLGRFGTSVSSAAQDPVALEQDASSVLSSTAAILSSMNGALSQALTGAQGVTQAQITAWSASVAASRTSVDTASGALTSAITARQAAEATLARDQKTLSLQRAGATQSALDAQRAGVSAAVSSADAIRAQIRDLQIVAPFSGIVTDTNGTVGENISPEVAVVSLMPDKEELDVKVNVSEDNILGVKPGDEVRIQLEAFPTGTEFAGTVIEVDPAETIIGGAVYYQTRIAFDTQYEGVRRGMTANVWIRTAFAEDALTIPASAIVRSASGQTSVQVLSGTIPEIRTVTIGITGQDGRVQILSGLEEGDRVVIGK